MSGNIEKRVLRVLEHIHDDPGADLSLDAMADLAAMSRFHWHRVFHAVTGETLADAVRRIRLHRAACRLVQTPAPVPEIAAAVGYANPRSFARAFTQRYGLSPAAFRARAALVADLPPTPKGHHAMFPVEITEVPARRLAAMSHRGPYHEIGRAFEKLSAVLTARNAWPQVRGMVAVYYDDPDATPAAELRSHAGFALADGADVPEGLEAVAIASGPAAILHFKGPYAGLSAAYGYLYGPWLGQSGREPADAPSYEVYLNSPMDTAPDDLLTDLVLPLK
jgi:AraC family transcriptional regulator